MARPWSRHPTTAVRVVTTGLPAARRAITPEAASGAQGTAGGAFGYADSWQRVMQATWSSPATSRLLLEAGVSTYISKWGWMEQPGAILNLNQVQEQAAQSGVFARRHSLEHAGKPHLPCARLELQQHAEPDDVEGRSLLRYRCAQHEDRVRRGVQPNGQPESLQRDASELSVPERRSRISSRCSSAISSLRTAASITASTRRISGRSIA